MSATLMDRSMFCDDRGTFENVPIDIPVFKFVGKRVYVCTSFDKGTVRAFHYHHDEAKVFVCLQGAVKFVLLPGIANQDMAHKVVENGAKVEVFVLSDKTRPLYIPADYANGWQALTEDVILLGASNLSMEESRKDDVRFPATGYGFDKVWEVIWR